MTESLWNESFRIFDENYRRICEEIGNAAIRSGRDPSEITLLAATKTVPVETILHAVKAGLSCIGENRVQEFLGKYDALAPTGCDLQFIGRLQTNKVKYLMDKVSCIQSVDSRKLAGEISRLGEKRGAPMKVLIEVNIGREENKGGILPDELYEFLDEVKTLPGIRIHGLMAVPPICDDPRKLRRVFSSITQYFVDIREKNIDNVSMGCLSMGMSADFKEAIECGSTMVRVGSSLFGKRVYPG